MTNDKTLSDELEEVALKFFANKGYMHSADLKEYDEKVKNFIKELKDKANDNRTISAAREEDCVLIETLNLIIDECAGKNLI